MIYISLKTIVLAIVSLTIVAPINTSEAANIVAPTQNIEQLQINLNTKFHKPQLHNEVALKKPFILIPGQSFKLYTKKWKGLVEGIQLTIKNFRTDLNGTRIEQILINNFQEHPDKTQKPCSSVLISKSTDYTLTPITNHSKHSRHRISLGTCKPGMSLELLDITDKGEATVILKYRR